jgi:hypothetical protein
MTVYVLFVMVWGASASGRAIDSRVEFKDLNECRVAAAQVEQVSRETTARSTWLNVASATCLTVTK